MSSPPSGIEALRMVHAAHPTVIRGTFELRQHSRPSVPDTERRTACASSIALLSGPVGSRAGYSPIISRTVHSSGQSGGSAKEEAVEVDVEVDWDDAETYERIIGAEREISIAMTDDG
jgi:hypothetical protein